MGDVHSIKVVCAILEQHNRVLVTQRNQNMAQPLLWEFPGGKLEPDEEEEQALIREIKEELQLDILPVKRLTPVSYALGDKLLELIPYICHYKAGAIQLVEHKAYQWAERSRLRNYNWCPADLPVLEEYLQLTQLSL
ncbi:(deoxy)nucleoside triphosphate pyrophosphohydrolase [Pontibacter qinzhouensis]|uniref:8-oxo-dGTP diphosphatase n=1 Tax=Pontibacter qinzhouensis TaxID=2603253 RepID=A0A5C8JG82_9BACT|nr:(deoxy)nucleoside triphosphate pyrophosphohydrolase [Pontibacter qinzhouensis]TXK36598.1 (deoxy)nucleoside triphosphate pyrophosphohydrolase [Pontibacter qinzhouensis]